MIQHRLHPQSSRRSRAFASIIGWCLVASASAAIPCSPVAEYHFDATSGTTVVDGSGNGLHGSFTSGFTWLPGEGWTGGCVRGDGVGVIALPESAALQPAHIGVSLWVKRTGTWRGQHQIFAFAKNVFSGPGWYIECYDDNGANVAAAMLVDGINRFAVLGDPDAFYPSGQWVHLWFEFDSATNGYSIWRNGEQQNATQLNTPDAITGSSSAQKIIGPTTATLDLMRIYSAPPAGAAAALAAEGAAVWDGGGGDDNWTTALNWVGDVVPIAGDRLVFTGTTRLTPNNDFAGGTAFRAITLRSSGFVVGGNALTLAGGISNDAGANNVNLPITLTRAQTLSAGSHSRLTLGGAIANGGHLLGASADGVLTIDGVISGGGGLHADGSGAVVLNAVNTYTGGTSAEDCELRAGAAVQASTDGAFGNNAGAVSVSDATLAVGAATFSRAVTAVDATIHAVGAARTVAAPVAATGTLALGAGSGLVRRYTVRDPGRWKGIYGADGHHVIGEASSYPAYVTVTPIDHWLYDYGAVPAGDDRPLEKVATTDRVAQVWYRDAPTSFTVRMAFTDGLQHQVALYLLDYDRIGRDQQVVVVDVATGVQVCNERVTDIEDGEWMVLRLRGTVDITFSPNGADSAILNGFFFDTPGSGHALTASGVISGAGSVTVRGPAVTTLGAIDTYEGGTSVAALGTLHAGLAGSVPAQPLSVAASGTFSCNGFAQTVGALSGAGSVVVAGTTLSVGADGGDATFSGVISGAGALTKTGGGIQAFSGANTYTGLTSISDGRLVVGHFDALGSDALGTVVADGATLQFAGAFNLGGEALTLTGAGDGGVGALYSPSGSYPTTAGKVTLVGSAEVNNESTSPVIFAANSPDAVTGTGALVLRGTGTLRFTGGTDYSGTTTIEGGTLEIDGDFAGIQGTSAITIDEGGELLINDQGTLDIDRIGNAVPITLTGGSMRILAPATASRSESFGVLTIGAGDSSITTTSAGVGIASLTASGWSRPGGGVLELVRGAAAPFGRLFLTGIANGAAVRWSTVTEATSTPGRYDTTNGLVQESSATLFTAVRSWEAWAAATTWDRGVLWPGAADDAYIANGHFVSMVGQNHSVRNLRVSHQGGINQGMIVTVLGELRFDGNSFHSAAMNFGAIEGMINHTADWGLAYLWPGSAFYGSAGFTKTGPGTYDIRGSGLYTGVVTVAEGALRASNATALGDTASGTVVCDDAVLEVSDVVVPGEPLSIDGDGPSGKGALRILTSGGWTGATTLTGDSTVGVSSGATATLSGTFAGAHDLTIDSMGTAILSGASAFSGASIVSGAGVVRTVGDVVADIAGPLGDAVGAVTLEGPALEIGGGFGRDIACGTRGGRIDAHGAARVLTADVVGAAARGLVGSYFPQHLRHVVENDWRDTRSVGGTRFDPLLHFRSVSFGTDVERRRFGITDGGGGNGWEYFSVQWDGWLTVPTAGTDLMTNSDDYSRVWLDIDSDGVVDGGEWGNNGWVSGGGGQGDTTRTVHADIPSGTYRMRVQYEEGVFGNVMTLLWDDAANSAGALDIGYVVPSSCLSSAIAFGGTTASGGAGQDLVVLGAVSGDRVVAKTGTSRVTLSGPGTWSGPTVIERGTLATGGAGAWPATRLQIGPDGAGDLAGNDQTVGSLSGAGAVLLGAARLTCGGDGTSTAFSGVISGTGGLTKAGAGTLTLSGASTLTGTSEVAAGTLQVSGSVAGAIAVSGGTLGGTGTVGAISASGGAIRPGTSAARGILTGGATSLASGATVRSRVAAYATPGTSYDRLALGANALTIAGTATLEIDLTGVAAAGIASGVITFASCSGRFSTVSVINAGSYTATVVYNATSIDVVVAPAASAAGLIAWYKSDGDAGTFVSDSSGNHHHATRTGGAWQPYGGRIDGALSGSNAVTMASISASTALQPSELTVAFWIRRDDATWAGGSRVAVWAKGTPTGDGWYVEVPANASWALALVVDDDTRILVNGSVDTFFPRYQWVHVACTFDPATPSWTMYRDGVAQATHTDGTSPSTITGTGDVKTIGVNIGGALDDIRIYGDTLGAAAIAALATGRSTRTWDGGGADNNWTTAANWVGDVAPNAGDDLVFAGATRLAPNNDFTAGTNFRSITFADPGFTLGGNALTVSAGVAAEDGAGTVSIAATLAEHQAFTAASGATLTVGAALANGGKLLALDGAGSVQLTAAVGGAGGLAKSGAGTATLTAVNGYLGATTLGAGTLQVTGSGTIGDVTVTGGTLGGTGTVGDIVVAGGEVRPGTAGAKGTLNAASTTVAGSADPTIRVRVVDFTLPGTNYDRLALGDGLVLSGDATLVVDLAGVVGSGTAVGAISYAPPDVRSGLFRHVRVENSGGRSARAQYTKDGIDIVVDDLIAHWRLDETAGVVVADATGNGHDGTIVAGSPTWMPTSGRIDGALAFDGVEAPIDVGTSIDLQPTNLSLAFWVKRTSDWSSVNHEVVWAKSTDQWDSNGWYAQIVDEAGNADRVVAFSVDGASAAWVDADANTYFPLGRWVHIAITFDSGANVTRFYRDGVVEPLAATTTVGPNSSITSSLTTKTIGTGADCPYDDIRLYGRVLAAGEIAALAKERRSTWDGGGANGAWTTVANWVGDVAPVADEELVFAGTLRTTNTNDFAAGTSFHSLAFNADADGFALGGSAIALANGVSALAGSNDVGTALTLSQDQSWSVASAATLTASAVIGGAADLTKSGAGSLLLSGANSFTGALAIEHGVVSARHASACGAVGTGTTVSDGAALAVHGVAVVAEPLSLDGAGPGSAGALRCTSAGSWGGPITLADDSRIGGGPGLTVSGTVAGSGAMTVDGLLIMSGVGAWTGGTTIATGTMRLAGGSALPDAGTVTFANVAGTTLDLDDGTETIGGLAGGGATGGLVDLGSGTLTLAGSGTTSYAGATTGTGGLVKLGSGVQVLAGTGGATGGTLINGGTLRVAGGDALPDASAVTITPLGVDTVYVEDALPAGATPDVTSDSWTWVATNPTPFSGALAHQSDSDPGTHQHYFYDATATMTVPVGAALFQYVYIDPLDPPREVLLQWHATDGSTWEHRAYWGANELGWGTDGSDSRRYQGPMPSLGRWLRLEVLASQVGLEGKTVNGCAYSLAGGRVTWDRSGFCTVPTPAFDLAGANEAIGSLAGSGVVSLGAGTLTTGGAGTSTTYAGSITGTGGLTKVGAGVFTLGAVNTYSGTTTVSAGQLLVDGSTIDSAVSLDGGTLGGIGTTGGIAAAAGGVIRPATSGARGTLHAGTTDLSGGSSPALRLRIAAYATAGTSYDQLDLATAGGALTLGGTSTLILDLAGLATTGTAAGVVTFGGACTTRFDQVQVLNNPNGWQALVDYTPSGALNVVIRESRRTAGAGAGYPPLY